MNSELLQVLVRAHGPFASVYLPANAPGTAWSVLRGTLAAQGAAPEVLSALDEALLDGATAEGRALIATHDGVLVDAPFAWSPPAPVARVSDLPYVLPLVPRHAVRAPEASLVAAGRARADTVSGQDRTVFDQFMFESSRPEGPVVQGLRRCAGALREGNADALVVTEDAFRDRSVWVGGTRRDQVAEEEAELRALGLPVIRQRADEAMPMAALTIGAEVLVTQTDVPLTDGVGVLLRHP